MAILLHGHHYDTAVLCSVCSQLASSDETCQTWGHGILRTIQHWLYSQVCRQQSLNWATYGNLGLLFTALDTSAGVALDLGDRFVAQQSWIHGLNELAALTKSKFPQKEFTAIRMYVWKIAHRLGKIL
eukprot:TRINITY_DN38545_c0_g1_i1.p1 TRINITY_DN38545_c0_g1~~TRINITY_DN38545_c0_g1_i1.p1  ORF type:complete len:128 (-),score=14.89 TRINITY_DN38545_c0_g1_i1:117-500(-)